MTCSGSRSALARCRRRSREPRSRRAHRADSILPADVKVGTAASSVIAATALAAAELWRLRTGQTQTVAVDVRAAVAAFRSKRFLRVEPRRCPNVRIACGGIGIGWVAYALAGRFYD